MTDEPHPSRDSQERVKRKDFVGGSSRGRTQPRQIRSRNTERRIIDTAIALCDGRDFSEVTVGEICHAAEVSPSSFYGRFRDRDALLSVVHEHYLDTMFNSLLAGMDEPDWARRTLSELVVRCCEIFLETGRLHTNLIATMQRTEVGRTDLANRRIRFERAGLTLMVDLVAERYEGVTSENRVRLSVAWSTLFAALRETLGPLDKAKLTGLPEPVLLAELARQFCAYVDLPLGPPISQPAPPGGFVPGR